MPPVSTGGDTRRSRLRHAGLMVVGMLSLLVLTGCAEANDQWQRLGLPEPASDRSEPMEDLWISSWIAALIIGAFVWGLILYASFRFRRRSADEVPPQTRYNLPIEVLYTFAPLIVVAVLFFFTIQKIDEVTAVVENPDHEITVTGQRWSWAFSYIDEEAAAPRTSVYDVGIPSELPQLWLVKDESVTFTLTSPDVIHSFWVPSFYFKLDVIPGRDQSFSMTPTKLGTFAGRCAELCGWLHSRMLFQVNVVDRATFDQHIEDLVDAGQIGEPRGQSYSSTVTGLEPSEGGAE